MKKTSPNPSRESSLFSQALIPLLFVLIWTSAFPAAKLGLLDSPPLLFLSVRFLIAGALLLLWSAAVGQLRWPTRPEWIALLVVGLFNHAVYLGLSWVGMTHLSSGMATLIISANPIVVSLLSRTVLGEPMALRQWLGLFLGFSGVAWVVQGRVGGPLDSALGFAQVALALCALALGTVLYKRWPVNMHRAASTGYQILLSAAALLPVALLMESPAELHLTPRFLWALLWLIGVVSIVGYLLWFSMLEGQAASKASAWMFMTPPLGVLAGWWVLNEPLHAQDLWGIIPVALGIALVTCSPSKA